MSLGIEFLELAVSTTPAIAAALLARRAPISIGRWFISVLGTATLAVVSIGLLLMRLTASCLPQEVTCPSPSLLAPRVPGIFKACQICTTPSTHRISELINERSVDIQALATALCVAISVVTIVRFMVWARKALSAKDRTGSS